MSHVTLELSTLFNNGEELRFWFVAKLTADISEIGDSEKDSSISLSNCWLLRNLGIFLETGNSNDILLGPNKLSKGSAFELESQVEVLLEADPVGNDSEAVLIAWDSFTLSLNKHLILA